MWDLKQVDVKTALIAIISILPADQSRISLSNPGTIKTEASIDQLRASEVASSLATIVLQEHV